MKKDTVNSRNSNIVRERQGYAGVS